MTYRIDLEPCINCGLCRLACPTDTIKYYSTGHRTHVVIDSGCIDCAICANVCPMACIVSLPETRPAPEQLVDARERARMRAKLNRAATHEIDSRVAAFIEGTSVTLGTTRKRA